MRSAVLSSAWLLAGAATALPQDAPQGPTTPVQVPAAPASQFAPPNPQAAPAAPPPFPQVPAFSAVPAAAPEAPAAPFPAAPAPDTIPPGQIQDAPAPAGFPGAVPADPSQAGKTEFGGLGQLGGLAELLKGLGGAGAPGAAKGAPDLSALAGLLGKASGNPPPAKNGQPASSQGSPALGGLAGLLQGTGLGLGGDEVGTVAQTSGYASYQREILAQGARGQVPIITTDPNKLEDQARTKLNPKAFGFVAGYAGEGATLRANREAFKEWRIVPKMLAEPGPRNLGVELFGKRHPTPVLIAPIGFQHILHPDGEPGAAAAASALGIPYVMSGNSHATMENISQAIGNYPERKWYQLYWQAPDAITTRTLQRAQAAGFSVLVVTLDAFTLGWRPVDLDQGYMPTNVPDGLAGLANLAGLTGLTGRSAADANATEAQADPPAPGLFGPFASWERIPWLRTVWKGPILLKGIQHVDDARRALAVPVDGIIVSNHGGRQLDGAVGSLEVLPEIVAAVGGKVPVLFDSGIRTGSDVLKALALGARAVLVGRPWAYGLGINGQAGALAVLKGILAQVEINMSVAGLKNVSSVTREILRRAPRLAQ